uniref:ABC transporter B family member 9-like isoform X1 n=1 Tax=Rhizophora mucronata TaxID=61149 RepID=A0A2P2KL23_RHIMU
MLSSEVGQFIQLPSTFIGIFLVAFRKGWHLAVVLLSCTPLLVVVSGTMNFSVSEISICRKIAYIEAGD